MTPNKMRPGWEVIVPATDRETQDWLHQFRDNFPQRSEQQTAMLRRLRLEGSVDVVDIDRGAGKRVALRSLAWRRNIYRDFKKQYASFADADAESRVYFLTDAGIWLTGLMK